VPIDSRRSHPTIARRSCRSSRSGVAPTANRAR
jgi:hypothetical protein